ncbi:MAG: TRAP transporter small permease [Lachnospiraceae bacterium]|jgi:TRAP-type C4-dicarboxylate transport system permease small subunit|nr:TRAP transporter small permease [Lachnospiraceae bacterium]MCI9282867.1 TRAP transporter small permease [Lachnospiraceae bacterium]
MRELFTVVKKVMTKLLAAIATILLSIMTLLVLYQVFTRYVLNSPAAFTEELVRYFLIWTGFVGAAYAFITREHMCLVLVRDSLKPESRRILMTVIDVLILIFAIFVITIGGFKLAMSAQKVFSALLGIPRSLVYAMAPVSGLFIIVAQIINIYEDVTGITIEGGNES